MKPYSTSFMITESVDANGKRQITRKRGPSLPAERLQVDGSGNLSWVAVTAKIMPLIKPCHRQRKAMMVKT